MARAKKDPSVRARRNVAATRATLPANPKVRQPQLPRHIEWHPMTREWWKDLWASPMASEYHTSDRHGLFVLATLMNQFWNEPSQALAAEIRLQRVSFGLTPYDRRRLEWTIEAAEDAKSRGRQRVQKPTPVDPDNDPRKFLSVVS